MKILRSEFPNPQFRRDNWLCLNGEWEFEMDIANEKYFTDHSRDNSNKVYSQSLEKSRKLESKIIVPFCPESELSGIGYKGYMDAVWYRRDLIIPENMKDKRIILHFGAVDHEATIFINGNKVGTHVGGYTPFSFDITDFLNYKNDYVTVYAQDDLRNGKYGGGKQSPKANSYQCYYTRTTGIWQSVWIEAVESQRIDFFRLTPVVEESALSVELNTTLASDVTLTATATFNGEKVGEKSVEMKNGYTAFSLALSKLELWDLGKGNLYDLTLTLTKDGKEIDKVYSYFGMRSVCFKDGKFYLNGRSVFGRFILDQGFYPDGIYTAKDTSYFTRDIRLAMDLGFNGARFHEKIFEPLALYEADKLGYMVWDEYPDWGMDHTSLNCLPELISVWQEEIKRDYNHPCIIGWCCLNETWDIEYRRQNNDVLKTIYSVVKNLDNTRPVIDTSGNYHVATDTYDTHDYEQDPEIWAKNFANDPYYDRFKDVRQTYNGTPYWVSEYGGIKLSDGYDGWGYGATKSKEEFIARYKGLTDVLIDNSKCWALCYTQLTDVEQEQNGLYFYDRTDRFTKEEKEQLRAIMVRKAAVEF